MNKTERSKEKCVGIEVNQPVLSMRAYLNRNLRKADQPELELPFPSFQASYKKGEVVSDFGIIENRFYYLKSGMVEVCIKKERSFAVLDFHFPDHWFCAYTSMLLRQPSDVKISALTEIEVEYGELDDLKEAYRKSITANHLGRHLTELIYLSKVQKEKDLLTKTAKTRYYDLVSKNSEFIQNLPIGKIAQFLGIHPESLSRIRKSGN